MITSLRFVFSLIMIFCPAMSAEFLVLYAAAGASDVLDGIVARATGSASMTGSRLDTAADMVFVAVCLAKLIPVLGLSLWIYIWTAVIVLVKAVNIVSGYVMKRRLVAVHSAANRVAGVLLFLMPLAAGFADPDIPAAAVCAVATFASVQEGHLIRTGSVLVD